MVVKCFLTEEAEGKMFLFHKLSGNIKKIQKNQIDLFKLKYNLHTVTFIFFGVWFYDFWQMHTLMYHHNQDIEQFHHPQKSLLPLSISFPHPALDNHWSVLRSYSFAFSRTSCIINGAILNTRCSLLSLAYFTWHNAAEIYPCISSSLLLLSSIPFHYMGLPQFIYPFTSWRTFRLFLLFLVIVRKASINIPI